MATITHNKIFAGTFIHSKTREKLEYLHNTAIAVSAEGVIVAICSKDDSQAAVQAVLKETQWPGDTETLILGDKQFFFPGLIDTHVHASQYPNVGIFGKSTLLDWLNTYTFPLESSLANPSAAHRVYTACVRRTLAHGTTAAAYYATQSATSTAVLADVCLHLGQRALVGRVCMDQPDMCPEYYRDESPAAALAASVESIEYIRQRDPLFDLVTPVLTPRFAPSCSPRAMADLAALAARHNLPIQTHISENTSECALVGRLFPDLSSYSAVYHAHNLLTPRTILAHAIHLSDAEAALLASNNCKISHCPCSNSALTSGAARVRWLWSHGLSIGLGTDMSGGYSPSILEAARHAALVSRHVAMHTADDAEKEGVKLTVDEVLYLATRGGADVIGMADRVGGFEVGKQWDAIHIQLATVDESGLRNDDELGGDAGNVDLFGTESWEEIVAKWLYNGDDRNCKKVWVKGRLVHQRR
ncbi:hypothetical protein TD95_000603 [Thielaviopsis punctulata]|uniref:Probable guanine deaminase n=1 Tax=Thielaviopsis punctulata TaxID=72032 RepID=A0A0F4ZLY2_9PEZI|nr:hypothetical protein TD95_000603 [Thielaviopsis punctulata]